MDSNSLHELQQIFEYELKRKLTERAKSSSGEIKILLNSFKFFDLNYSGIIDKNRWIQGIFRTGLSGFSESDLDSLFSVYDKNNSGQIDYKNFCSFLYGREQLNPLENQTLKINDNASPNNISQINQNQENQISNMNQINQSQNVNSNFNQMNQYQENIEQNMDNNQNNNILQNKQIRNFNEGANINNNMNNTHQERKKAPLHYIIQNNNNYDNMNNQRNQIDYNNNQNSNNNNYYNYLNKQKTPKNDYNEYEYNNNFRHTQRNINSYNNTFNNIFQQESLSNQNSYDENTSSYNNISENKINSIISSIKSCILINNGITLFTLMKKLKDKQLNYKGISLEDLNNIFQDMRINISLNDLKILFNVLTQNSNKNNGNISFDQLINLIKGNLQERRKLYIIGIFANIDNEKKGEVSIQTLKNMYNSKYHPDVLNGTKNQKDAFEQFCYSLDLYCEVNDIQSSGNLSFENFIDYYSGVSACIPDDVYFEDILNGVWNNNHSLNNISYNDVNVNNNVNNNNATNEKNEFDNYGMNSILMGISPNDRSKRNNNQYNNRSNNNIYNQINSDIKTNNNNYNDSFSNIIQRNNNDPQISQLNNNDFNDNYQFKNSRRLKNSASSPFIPDKSSINRQNNILNDNNNNLNNYSNKQSSSILSNTIPLSQKVSTPFRQSGRTQEGIKVYQKRRYNPITDEYYNDFGINANNDKGTDNIINDNDDYSTIQNTPSNIRRNLIQNNNNYIESNSIGIIDKLRNVIISRGSKSIFNFQRMLSIYDRKHSGQISLDDFIAIFQTYNFDFSSSDIQNIFQQFDSNQTGAINYDLLIDSLIGQLDERRRLSVQKVYDNFNKNEQGEVLLSEIKQKYNSSRHPDVISGRKRREEEFGEFLDKIEIFREYNDNLKMSYSTTMNFNEFLKFYSEISMSIKDDNLFDNILFNCWNANFGLEDRNVNYFNNNNDRNYDKNIRARTGKQIMNRNNIPY